MNSTIRQEGICPLLLVYGAVPRPARATPCLTELIRARKIEAAMEEAEMEESKRRVSFGAKHNQGGSENTNDLDHLSARSKVLIYRPKAGKWEGYHTFVSSENETAVIQTR